MSAAASSLNVVDALDGVIGRVQFFFEAVIAAMHETLPNGSPTRPRT